MLLSNLCSLDGRSDSIHLEVRGLPNTGLLTLFTHMLLCVRAHIYSSRLETRKALLLLDRQGTGRLSLRRALTRGS